MNAVEPIRDMRKLELIKQYLKENSPRNYVLFVLGTNTGLRISDILPIKVGQIRGTHIDIKEKKTGKTKLIKINKTLREALDNYTANMQDYEYLFKSRNMKQDSGKKYEPIDCSMAYKVLNEAAQRFGVESIGTHSLRKTFGYHYYLRTKNIALLMELFNHSEESITLRYIGIRQDTLDEALNTFSL